MINVNFSSEQELIRAFPTQEDCIKHLEQLRWNGNVVSPFSATSKVYKCSGHKYKCKATGKYFNVCTGTPFDNTKIGLTTWFLAIYLISNHKSISCSQLANTLNVSRRTAWHIINKFDIINVAK